MYAPASGVLLVPPDFVDDVQPDQEVVGSQVRFQRGLWDRLSRIAGAATMARKRKGLKPPVVSRNDVMEKVLTEFADDYEKANVEHLAEYDVHVAANAQEALDGLAPLDVVKRIGAEHGMAPEYVEQTQTALKARLQKLAAPKVAATPKPAPKPPRGRKK